MPSSKRNSLGSVSSSTSGTVSVPVSSIGAPQKTEV